MQFSSIMDYVQALFSFFIAPLFGTVLLGMLWKRVTPAAGFWGLLAGSASSVTMFLLVKFNPRMLAYIALSGDAKAMAENMYRALWSWLICVIVTVAITYMTEPKPVEELTGLVYGCTELPSEGHLPLWNRPVFWAAVSLAIFLVLQWIFW
jgi:SSS family solute:Na+ symporter